MRIVIWNCNMALHRKLDALARLAPDIAVLPEAGESSRIPEPLAFEATRTYEWIGNISYKGLGAMAFAPFEIELACQPDRSLEWVLPLSVRGPIEFTLLAVWALNHRASSKATGPNRESQVTGALETYGRFFDERPVVVAGDLNDSAIWDKKRGPGSFATKVELLKQRGLRSAYHEVLGVPFGEESVPTLYWRDRTADGPRYHIDYCFIPESWIPHTSVTVGGFEEWVAPKYSDHVPLTIDVDLPA